jgi:hypothetical protein
VAKRALSLAGISCRPLGTDNAGREYWRFPTSHDLFIREGSLTLDPDKEAFKRLLAGTETDTNNHTLPPIITKRVKGWKRVVGVDKIRRIGEYLGENKQEQG